MWSTERILERLNRNIIKPLEKKGLNTQFSINLTKEFPRLLSLYKELYGNLYDCLYQLEELVEMMAVKNMNRPSTYEQRDKDRLKNKNWFASRKSVGIMLYVDLFNIDLKGLKNKLDYFSDLGINAIHLMPLFKAPEGDSDGGYAVSDYQAVRKELGSMKELAELAEIMRRKGMALILDFILNHTSNDHEWANEALKGNSEFQEYYYMFETREEADSYDRHLREIFPSVRKGSFTFVPQCEKWIWTTFNSFQWDLNYSNPALFRAMSEQMLFLANHGADVLRLDALAFSWKEQGTICENLPKTHTLIQAFRSVAKIAAPGLAFLSEAIVHPVEVINYISEEECELSYNSLLMATIWEALATRNTSLLQKSFFQRFSIPENCRWINYTRCHDDIGWTFCDDDAASLHINGYDHRRFLNSFYTGKFNGSFASGVPFQENIDTGDARISGTLASLAGLEKAESENNSDEREMAVKRIKMLMAITLSMPGIPLIYSGDELAILNDYSYMDNVEHRHDSRWVHRMGFPWAQLEKKEENSIPKEIYNFVKKMISLRSKTKALDGTFQLLKLENNNLLGFNLEEQNDYITIIVNFTERKTELKLNTLRICNGHTQYINLIDNKTHDQDLIIEPYQILWLKGVGSS